MVSDVQLLVCLGSYFYTLGLLLQRGGVSEATLGQIATDMDILQEKEPAIPGYSPAIPCEEPDEP